jgi:hypothetical protein
MCAIRNTCSQRIAEKDAAHRAGAGRSPDGHAEVLAAPDSLFYFGGTARFGLATTRPLDALLDAFRSGGGIPYASSSVDMHEGLAEDGWAAALQLPGTAWFPAVPSLDERLRAAPPARPSAAATASSRSSTVSDASAECGSLVWVTHGRRERAPAAHPDSGFVRSSAHRNASPDPVRRF